MEGKKIHDLIIVGGGPIGLSVGVSCAKRGVSYLILEKGCLVNSIYHFPMNMTFFSTPEKIEIEKLPFTSINLRPSRREGLEYYRQVAKHFNLAIRLYEEVIKIERRDNSFGVTSSKGKYETKAIVLACGFYDIPNKLNVAGEELAKVKHYFDDPHLYFHQDVAVIGGANSAVDAALETYRKGAQVTLIVRDKAIKKSIKYWVKPDIENRIKNGEIKALFNSEIKAIKENEIIVKTPKGLKTLANDYVLAMTGYGPNYNLLNELGIRFDESEFRKPLFNSETMESNAEGVYLAGVICGGKKSNEWFIENSLDHGEKIIKNFLNKDQ